MSRPIKKKKSTWKTKRCLKQNACTVSSFFGSETFNIKVTAPLKKESFDIFNLQSKARLRGRIFFTGAIRNYQISQEGLKLNE